VTMENRLVSVCIASIGRPSLLLTISGVRACPLPAGFDLEIVVADDSLNGAALALLATLDDQSRLHLIASAAKNISMARNACLTHSMGEYIVFIDDDEVPGYEWLQNLVQVAENNGADAVQGSVVGSYPDEAPGWASKLRPFDKAYGQTGDRIQVGSTCNLLFRRSSLSKRSLQFSSVFGQSGGEDTDFCYRLTASGGSIVCSPEAVVFENVPLERLTFKHLIRRYARGGHTYASVVLARQSWLRRGVEVCKALLLTAAYSVLAVVSSPALPAASMRYTLRVSGNVGKLIFFFGRPAWNLY